MNEWKKLDINNLPSDIMVGDYEFWAEYPDFNGNMLVERDVALFPPTYVTITYRSKKQTPPPTHEEIMTKWWAINNARWARVISYFRGEYIVIYHDTRGYETSSHMKDWFTGKESADIPPEAPIC